MVTGEGVETDAVATEDLGSPVVAHTNLVPSRIRTQTIQRRHLVDRRLASDARLGIISGPAGSGKSTLLAQCHVADPGAAWLSVTESANDPVVLWWSIVTGIREVVDGFGEDYIDRLVIAGASVLDQIVTSVANELAERGTAVHLFLDDFHLLENEQDRRSVHALITQLPNGTRVTIASRTATPVPLARLRVEGELVQITAADLALTVDEAAAVLHGLGADIELELVRGLNDRTEGWAAGIALAGMALADADDPDQLITELEGTDRLIAPYLVAEVLAATKPAEQEFLRQTAVLERMCGDLCDALTGRSDGAATLAGLVETNAFVVPLDRTATWYRYHHLFGEVVAAEVHKDPAEEALLHDRAFEWHRDRGEIADAVRHALRANRRDEAANLLCAHWVEMMNSGQLATVVGLIGEFPDRHFEDHQPLANAAAFALGMAGRRAESREYLRIAERATYDGDPPDGTVSLEASLALTRGCLAHEGLGRALVDGQLAYELEPPGSPWRTLAALVVGLARIMNGDIDGSVPFFEEVARAPDPAMRAYALAELALARLADGEPDRSVLLAEEAQQTVTDSGLGDLMPAAVADAAMAHASLALGDSKAARASLRAARRPMEILGQAMPMDTMNAAVLLGEAAVALDEQALARRYAGQAARIAATISDTGAMGDRLEQLQAQLQASAKPAAEGDLTFTERELEVLALAATSLTTGQIGEELYLSRNTIKTYLRRIYRKFDASSRDEAVERPREAGLIPDSEPS